MFHRTYLLLDFLLVKRQLAGAIQYITETHPAPDSELHRHTALASRGADVSQLVSTPPSRLCQRRQSGQRG